MNKEELMKKTKDLIAVPYCCSELKTAAQNWLDAVGTEKETEEAKKYIAEMEADIDTNDDLIQLTESEKGIQYFGAEKAKAMAEHGKEIKAAGAKYCDCAACSLVEELLNNKETLLS